MSERINYQVLEHNGHPAFAVVPYKEFMRLLKQKKKNTYYPDEVVRLNIIEGMSLLKAWRVFKGKTQKEVSKRAGISQPALAQMEQPDANVRKDTLRKLAGALELDVEQLTL